jgi:transcriptional regulator with GAF, ATPase, and Fis domain
MNVSEPLGATDPTAYSEEVLLVAIDAHDRVVVSGVLPRGGLPLLAVLREVEISMLRRALTRTGHNQTHAARLLRLSFRQFRHLTHVKYKLLPRGSACHAGRRE